MKAVGMIVTHRCENRPGALIERMPESIREALKDLKSDDMVYGFKFDGDMYESVKNITKRILREEKIKFDKLMR